MESPPLHLKDILKDIEVSLLRPLFFGLITTASVYGVVNLQAYRYFSRYTRDTAFDKTSVGSLCLLLAVYVAIVFFSAYFSLVRSWNHSSELLNPALSETVKVIVTSDVLIINFVHTLYGMRAWNLSSNVHRLFRIVIVVAILSEYGVDLFALVQLYRRQSFIDIVHYNKIWNTGIYSIFLSATCTDLILSILVSYVLRKSSTEFESTKSRISTLMKYTVASGMLTSLLDLAALVTHAVLPQSFTFYGLSLPLPCLYVNSYIALLNTRLPPPKLASLETELHGPLSNVKAHVAAIYHHHHSVPNPNV